MWAWQTRKNWGAQAPNAPPVPTPMLNTVSERENAPVLPLNEVSPPLLRVDRVHLLRPINTSQVARHRAVSDCQNLLVVRYLESISTPCESPVAKLDSYEYASHA